jgi:hypothetical protein
VKKNGVNEWIIKIDTIHSEAKWKEGEEEMM